MTAAFNTTPTILSAVHVFMIKSTQYQPIIRKQLGRLTGDMYTGIYAHKAVRPCRGEDSRP